MKKDYLWLWNSKNLPKLDLDSELVSGTQFRMNRAWYCHYQVSIFFGYLDGCAHLCFATHPHPQPLPPPTLQRKTIKDKISVLNSNANKRDHFTDDRLF